MRRAFAFLAAALVAGCASSAREPVQPRDPFAERYRALHPSIVLLTMRVPAAHPKRPGELEDAYGTGFVVASGSWGTQILTDAHVVADERELHVLVGDHDASTARVLARDHANDLALIGTPLRNERVVTLGDSRSVVPGTAVGVLGYPIPDAFQDEKLGTTVSIYTGHVSSRRRDSFELDLPIIPGESGGPVFEAESGAVIGIAESRFEEERAIGFATPIETAKAFLHAHARGFSATR